MYFSVFNQMSNIEIEKLILSTIAISGILIAFKFKGVFHKAISIGLTVCILLVWINSKCILTNSFIIFGILTITTVIYGLIVKEINLFEKISIIIMGLFLTNSFIFTLFHLPFAGQIKLSMIIPISLALITFIKGRKLTKEMSFMLFWLFYATLELLKIWIY